MDRDDLRRALVDLRVAFDDADAVTSDALRPPRKRELGPILHRQNYGEARRKVLAAHTAAMHLLAEPERGDPSGSGGAGSVH